jgi:RNA polymerase sigma-70 factor, ECF subfamily
MTPSNHAELLEPDRSGLLDRARRGDSAALGDLLESYRSYLFVLADLEIGRRLQRKVDAGDIVQETFLEAHRQFPRFQGQVEAQLTEWLRTILAGVLANTVRRYFGTQARDLRIEQELIDDLNHSSCQFSGWAVDPESTPSAQAMRFEQTLLIAEGLAKLPEDYRKVLLFRHLEGLPFGEIAARMGRSVDSVEKLWVRGLAKLKQFCAGGRTHGVE